ncbi:glycosyltransferase [Vibrio parahaemolyticus]|uniref:glycosyltransferase n=1 Tax=Vibrio parahaemolyticus TaxID=670 RepID=UPI00042A5553|nr:glycosyltransferase [Vibrio parahaemolyticus]HCH5086976.1 glycosyltransferase [Vibrio parahaemolyticus]
MNNKKGIKIITLYGNKVGGTEKAASDLRNVLSTKYRCNIEYLFDNVTKNNINKIDQCLMFFKILFKLQYEDVCITTDYATYCLLIIASLFKKKFKHIIMWEHVPKDRNGKFWLFLEHTFSLSSKADTIITLSELEYSKWNNPSAKKILIINNAISTNGNELYKSRINNKEGLVYVGRVTKDKGVERLIDAFLEFFPDNINLKIVGDGDELERLKYRYKNKENVIFLGQRDNIAQILSQSKVFVSGSYYECFPISILEAMSLSLPIVSFDQSGGTESVLSKAGCGFIVSTGQEFFEKINLMLKDDNYLSLGERGYNFVSKNYNPEKYSESWIKVLDGL